MVSRFESVNKNKKALRISNFPSFSTSLSAFFLEYNQIKSTFFKREEEKETELKKRWKRNKKTFCMEM